MAGEFPVQVEGTQVVDLGGVTASISNVILGDSDRKLLVADWEKLVTTVVTKRQLL